MKKQTAAKKPLSEADRIRDARIGTLYDKEHFNNRLIDSEAFSGVEQRVFTLEHPPKPAYVTFEPEPPKHDDSLVHWLQVVFAVLVMIVLAFGANMVRNQQNRLDALSEPIVLNGLPKATIDLPATTAATGTLTYGSGALSLVDSHTFRIELSANCWIAVTEQTPKAEVLFPGEHKQAGDVLGTSMAEQATVEVRAGCPGDVHYTVNGQIVHPDNVSKTPDKSEVVDLLI
jgi:hypothetical protein